MDNQNPAQKGDSTTQGSATSGTTLANTQVRIDKNKSAADYLKEAESIYIIPQMIREKFPDLIKLIYETESMNVDEREYWLQIMPIMTEEQILKFREILVNEKDQLAKLDREYKHEMGRINPKYIPVLDEAEIKERNVQLKQAETAAEKDEHAEEEKLLNALAES